MTPFGKFLERNVKSLCEEAVKAALDDAGVSTGDVDQIYFGNAAGGTVNGQEMIRAQAAFRNRGLAGQRMFNVEHACASSAVDFLLEWIAYALGQRETAVVGGVENLSHDARAVHCVAFAGAVVVEGPT